MKMKLPILDLKKILNVKLNKHIIYLRPNNILNYSPSGGCAIKYYYQSLENIPHSFSNTRKYIKELLRKQEMHEKEKARKQKKYNMDYNLNINKYNYYSQNCSSNNSNRNSNNTMNSYNYKSHDNIDDTKKDYKYIKYPFTSNNMIKDNSAIYCSPIKNRFINIIMKKYTKNSIIFDKNSKKLEFPLKIKTNNSITLSFKEQDEDKIKEGSLFTMFLSNKKNFLFKDKREKSFGSWNNKLLKNILPKKIKNYNEYKDQEESKNNIKLLNSLNNKKEILNNICKEKFKKIKLKKLKNDRYNNDGNNSNNSIKK